MISVCIPHFEREDALRYSLIAYDAFYDGLEVSIVDDGSRKPLALPILGLKTIVSRIDRPPGPLNPCVPINKAVSQSTGDVIVLTSPEIIHKGDVLTPMLAELSENTYIAARCHDPKRGQLVPSVSSPRIYPVPENAGFHFCAMLTRTLWEKAGGFDEDYRDGQAFEDNDFLWRLFSAGAEFKIADVEVEHMPMPRLNWPSGGWERNRQLFEKKWPFTM